MSHNVHAKGPSAFRDFKTNLSESDDPQGFSAKFGSLKRFFFPLSCVHELVGSRDKTSHAQHKSDRDLGDGYRISAGRIHYGDSLARGRFELDVVHTDPSTANYSQFGGIGQ